MQTFLPYPDFEESARCLDKKRLGKQRSETLQIFQSIIDPTYGWQHHPAVTMWRGYEGALLIYGCQIAMTWVLKFGYRDSTHWQFETHLKIGKYPEDMPHWIGDQEFHDSQVESVGQRRSTLLSIRMGRPMQFTVQVALRPPEQLSFYRVYTIVPDFSAVVAGSKLRDDLVYFLREKTFTARYARADDILSEYELYAQDGNGHIIMSFDNSDRELVEEFLTARDS